MFAKYLVKYLIAEYLYLIFSSFYNVFWILASFWSLGKNLRNTFFQQVISILALCCAWCFTPNSLIQLFFKYLEDPDRNGVNMNLESNLKFDSHLKMGVVYIQVGFSKGRKVKLGPLL